jgi:hypothetical protein
LGVWANIFLLFRIRNSNRLEFHDLLKVDFAFTCNLNPPWPYFVRMLVVLLKVFQRLGTWPNQANFNGSNDFNKVNKPHFSHYDTHNMNVISVQGTAMEYTYMKSLKTLEIRTHGLLIRRRRQWPLHKAAMASYMQWLCNQSIWQCIFVWIWTLHYRMHQPITPCCRYEHGSRVARFFVVQHTKTWKNTPIDQRSIDNEIK